MSSAAMGAGAGAAAQAAIAQAIKASGAMVEIEAADFEELIRLIRDPLVLHQEPGGMFSRKHQYATSHGGFIFFARAREPIYLPRQLRPIPVKKIWTPD